MQVCSYRSRDLRPGSSCAANPQSRSAHALVEWLTFCTEHVAHDLLSDLATRLSCSCSWVYVLSIAVSFTVTPSTWCSIFAVGSSGEKTHRNLPAIKPVKMTWLKEIALLLSLTSSTLAAPLIERQAGVPSYVINYGKCFAGAAIKLHRLPD